MKRAALIALVVVALPPAAVACGVTTTKHYTLLKSRPCLARIGKIAGPAQYGGVPAGGEAVAALQKHNSMIIELFFMRTATKAVAYLNRGFPPGLTATKGNVVIWIHQPNAGGTQPSNVDLIAVERCLA